MRCRAEYACLASRFFLVVQCDLLYTEARPVTLTAYWDMTSKTIGLVSRHQSDHIRAGKLSDFRSVSLACANKQYQVHNLDCRLNQEHSICIQYSLVAGPHANADPTPSGQTSIVCHMLSDATSLLRTLNFQTYSRLRISSLMEGKTYSQSQFTNNTIFPSAARRAEVYRCPLQPG
jgi:hypothetical protein